MLRSIASQYTEVFVKSVGSIRVQSHIYLGRL